MRTLFSSLMVALAVFAATGTTTAQSAADKGKQIAMKTDKADEGFGSFTNTLTMVLKNRHGQETTRKMKGKTLEVAGDGDKSLIVFLNPADVKGTASMTYTHRVGADDQWLYLPALKRVKRISSANKSGPFMGSEFAFEDIASQEVDKYTYKYIEPSKANGVDCELIERYPVDPKSGYTKQRVWINKSNWRVEKIDFYDRKKSKLKTLTFKNYKKYKTFWRAGVMHMVNHQNGKSTVLKFDGYNFDANLTEDDFTQNSLRRAN